MKLTLDNIAIFNTITQDMADVLDMKQIIFGKANNKTCSSPYVLHLGLEGDVKPNKYHKIYDILEDIYADLAMQRNEMLEKD
jgi:hypothetical protein